MVTKGQSAKVNLDRRAVLMLGLAGATALIVGKGSIVSAADDKGVERNVLKEAESMIQGYPKIRLRTVRWQPGAKTEATMTRPMICECTEGSFESTVDGQTFTRNTGDIWTCGGKEVIVNVNNGKTPATMRVFDLLPA